MSHKPERGIRSRLMIRFRSCYNLGYLILSPRLVDMLIAPVGHTLLQVLHIIHSVEQTRLPIFMYSSNFLSIGQFSSHFLQAMHFSRSTLILRSAKRAVGFINTGIGQTILQKARLSFIITANMIPIK